MGNAREILRAHSSSIPSKWKEQAESRRLNKGSLKKSQLFALKVLDLMDEYSLSQKELAAKMNVSQQYVSKLLKGTENITFDTVSKVEAAFNCTIVEFKIVNRYKSKCIFKYETTVFINEETNFNVCRFAFNS